MIILYLLFAFLISLFLSSYILMAPSKWIEHPWDRTNLNVYINYTNLLEKDKQSDIYDALLALEWWGAGGNQRLSYGVNFTVINNSRDANITINWVKKIKGGFDGITDVNTSSYQGSPTCNIYNPPFTMCNISLVKGFDDLKTQNIIRHELGHALGFKHAFNIKDYFAAYLGENYIRNPTEIMFDEKVIDATNLLVFVIFILLTLFSILMSIVIQRFKIGK